MPLPDSKALPGLRPRHPLSLLILVSFFFFCDKILWWKQLKRKRFSSAHSSRLQFAMAREVTAARLEMVNYTASTGKRWMDECLSAQLTQFLHLIHQVSLLREWSHLQEEIFPHRIRPNQENPCRTPRRPFRGESGLVESHHYTREHEHTNTYSPFWLWTPLFYQNFF